MTLPPIAKDYRSLLRYAKSLPSKDLYLPFLRKAMRNPGQSDPRVLSSYLRLVGAVKELQHLRYLDSGDKLDNREKVRLTAARVGLGIPAFADEKDVPKQ